jgi:hypothetical protein
VLIFNKISVHLSLSRHASSRFVGTHTQTSFGVFDSRGLGKKGVTTSQTGTHHRHHGMSKRKEKSKQN